MGTLESPTNVACWWPSPFVKPGLPAQAAGLATSAPRPTVPTPARLTNCLRSTFSPPLVGATDFCVVVAQPTGNPRRCEAGTGVSRRPDRAMPVKTGSSSANPLSNEIFSYRTVRSQGDERERVTVCRIRSTRSCARRGRAESRVAAAGTRDRGRTPSGARALRRARVAPRALRPR